MSEQDKRAAGERALAMRQPEDELAALRVEVAALRARMDALETAFRRTVFGREMGS